MNIKYAAVPIIALAVSACNPVDIVEGNPSAFKAEVERRQALTLPEPVAAPPAAVPVNLAGTVAPPVSVALPVCVRTFRVNGCDAEGRSIPWEPEP